jgi:hypothetical protein
LVLLAMGGFAGGALANEAKHHDASNAGDAKHRDASNSIPLPEIMVPLIVGGQVVGQAGVLVTLELADGRDFDRVDGSRQVLLDAFITELYGLFDQIQDRARLLDPEMIKAHLGRVIDRIVGQGLVKEIVILRSYERRT